MTGQLSTRNYEIKQNDNPQALIGATFGLGERVPRSWILGIRADDLNSQLIYFGDSGGQFWPLSNGQSVVFNKGEIPYDSEIFVKGTSNDKYTVVIYSE